MASRQTETEAQELKANFEKTYPDRTFRIINSSQERRIGRGVAEMKGYQIIEDDGSIMVTVNYTEFQVLEVRKCVCGAEVLTAAVGEDGLNECPSCKAERKSRQEQDGTERANRSAAKVREMTWRDAWEES
jgi:hypothetical protein